MTNTDTVTCKTCGDGGHVPIGGTSLEPVLGPCPDCTPHTPDVRVQNEGTIYQFFLLTDEAKSWVDAHVQDPLYLGPTLCVEHRYAANLTAGMIDDGLEVA